MIIHKTIASNGNGTEFVLSDATVDRFGDSIDPAGWDLKNFKQNPIALFGHDSGFPIGKWTDIQVKGSQLVAHLKFAAKGTSARIDELINLVEQGILRAVSVGFRPLEQEPMDKDHPFGGQRFKKQELLETSLVSVPANPAAVALAKSLNLSPETMSLVFGEQAEVRREITTKPGEKAVTPPKPERPRAMLDRTLSQQIEDKQGKLLELKDKLSDHNQKTGDDDDETSVTVRNELNSQIAATQRSLASLQEAEKQLGAQSAQAVERTASDRRPLSVPAPKGKPGDLVMRAIVAKVIAHATKGNPAQILAERYGSDGKVDEQTKVVFDAVTKAAVIPADTTTAGWASQLVETQIAGFLGLLLPASVYPALSGRGLRLNFGRSGIISIPSRVSTPTIAGAFIAQGAAIPVKQGAFTAITLTPKKMAVISTFTREIAEHSTPAIEGLIRDAMQEDTSVALDAVLLDATAATTTRPGGLRAGVSATTATSGGGFTALIGDIKALIGALITSTSGNIRNPVWIMNPIQGIAISLTQNAGGDFPFKQEINGNTLQGYPVILSTTVTAGMVILVDAADYVSVEGDAPRFDVSDQATLHMDDAPTAIGTAGSPNVVAAPVRSLWQTDTMGLRMLMDVNWALRRTGVVAWTQSVTW